MWDPDIFKFTRGKQSPRIKGSLIQQEFIRVRGKTRIFIVSIILSDRDLPDKDGSWGINYLLTPKWINRIRSFFGEGVL